MYLQAERMGLLASQEELYSVDLVMKLFVQKKEAEVCHLRNVLFPVKDILF
jgi:hypothetical protein